MPTSEPMERPHFGFKLPNCGGVLCETDWARPDTILELAGLARELGYDSVWLHDHLLTPRELQHLSQPRFYEPMTVMAAVAGAVPEIQVGVATLILPLRDPVLLAKQVVTMEHFFPGRTIIGVGLGQYESEFQAFGTDSYRSRGRVANEHLDIIEALLAEGPATVTGTSRSVVEAEAYPKPGSADAPTIWIGGNSDAAAKRAARYGTGWISSGALSPQDVEAQMSAIQPQRQPFHAVLTATVAREDLPAQPDAPGEHRIHQHASVIAGDAAHVARQVRSYVAAGVSHFLLTFRSADLDAVRAQMRWFISDVAPLVDGTQAEREAIRTT